VTEQPIAMIGKEGKPPFNLGRFLRDVENGVQFELIACPHIQLDATTGIPVPEQMAQVTRGHYTDTNEQVVTVTCPDCLRDVQMKGGVR
jgi:hypothetical protein